jgi:DNA-binding NarL/FixJ family response regulator
LNVLILGQADQSLTDWFTPLISSSVCTAVVFVLDIEGAQRVSNNSFFANVVILVRWGSNVSLELQVDSIRENNKGQAQPQIVVLNDDSEPVCPHTLHRLGITATSHNKDIVSFLEILLKNRSRLLQAEESVCDIISNVPGAKHNEIKNNRLTPRQTEVLSLVNLGKSNKQIAKLLNLTEGTIKVHCKAIFRALGVANRTQAAVLMAKADIGTRQSVGE